MVVELSAEAFTLRRIMRAVLQADHVSHLWGFCPSNCQSMPCKQVGKILAGSCYLACRELILAPLDCAAWILGRSEEQEISIVSASQGIFPLLNVQAPPFEEVIEWLQFDYTADHK